jgi:putative hydrolase of the HAD superfamily
VTRPAALILDYGEVLSHPMRPGAMSLMASQLGTPDSEFPAIYWRHRREYDLGMPARDYWTLVTQDVGLALDEGLLASLIAIDVDAWTDYRDEMWTLAATFRKSGGKLGMLSNGVREIVARIRGDHDLAAQFDTVVISYEERLAKPEPEIYRITLDRLGVPASDALFVDDRAENVEAARELGLQTLLFTGDVHALRALTLI